MTENEDPFWYIESETAVFRALMAEARLKRNPSLQLTVIQMYEKIAKLAACLPCVALEN